MAFNQAYVSFERSRFRFVIFFLGIIFLGLLVFGLTEEILRVLLIFFLLILLIAMFFYEFYLSTEPVIEILNDSLMIKEIYHPILKWRFIYKKHFFAISAILNIKVVKKNDTPKHVEITYQDGKGVRKVDVNSRDILQFDSFVNHVSNLTGNEKTTFIS